ncbi:MAG: hypothetical protein HOG89_03265 [Candidatus Peribacter sp.]|jgi:hypothetical protein|nr:hypothetical protein [Candidatus Peribacter sp.]MBT4393188.1 hypothetical protein [Candidatus Peribacter sp.]MBT4600468.1 hypothetical protein [Candidatus Peribacter sp.]MBT5148556.1 hypothetical protein [Candidatus Peribacter sp.]MBT5638722.1 hypothetical protein [Candidatus Peribacter sp.]
MSNTPTPDFGKQEPEGIESPDVSAADEFFGSIGNLQDILGDTKKQLDANSGALPEQYSGQTAESDPASDVLSPALRERILATGKIVYEHIPKGAKRVLICFQNDHGDAASVQRMQDSNLEERKSGFINHNQNITEFGQDALNELPPEAVRFFFESFPLDADQWGDEGWGESPLPESVLNTYPSDGTSRDKLLDAIATMSKGDTADQGFAKDLLATMSPSKRITRAATEQSKKNTIYGDGFPESRDDSLEQALDGHANIADMVKEHLPEKGVGMLVYGEEHFGSCARQEWPELAGKYFEDYLQLIPDLHIVVVEESHLPQLHKWS